MPQASKVCGSKDALELLHLNVCIANLHIPVWSTQLATSQLTQVVTYIGSSTTGVTCKNHEVSTHHKQYATLSGPSLNSATDHRITQLCCTSHLRSLLLVQQILVRIGTGRFHTREYANLIQNPLQKQLSYANCTKHQPLHATDKPPKPNPPDTTPLQSKVVAVVFYQQTLMPTEHNHWASE